MSKVYDVLTYQFAENTMGIPANWPALLNENDSEDALAENWIRFNSVDDYNAYVTSHSSEYETYIAIKQLEQQRLEVWANIKVMRDERQLSGIKVGNYWFHSDNSSRIKYLGLLMIGANIPANLQWKTMTGVFVTMTQTLAGQIFSAIAAFDSQSFIKAEQHKAAMQASSDPLSYDFSTGWPLVYGE